MYFQANLLASTEETKPNTMKVNIHPKHKNTTTQTKHKKTKACSISGPKMEPGLFYSSQGPHGARDDPNLLQTN